MSEADYDSEKVLQALLEKYPNLMPGDQIDEINPRHWLLISREMGIPDNEGGSNRWSVDHLFLDQDGIPTLVEVKRSSDTRIRREVVGQLLEYAANAVVYWSIDQIRNLFESTCKDSEEGPEERLINHFDKNLEYESFWEQVRTNLAIGRIRLIFLADEIPLELKRVIEFLNEQMNPAEVIGIEIKQYVGSSHRTLVPQVIGQTSKTQYKKSKPSTAKFQWDEKSFMAELENRLGTEEVKIAEYLLRWAGENGLNLWWGKGKKHGSFFPILEHRGESHWLFSAWTYDGVEIQFQWIKTRSPYQELSRRVKLLHELNRIPGVSIPEDAVDRRPSIKYSVLKDGKSLDMFLGIWGKYIEDIRSA